MSHKYTSTWWARRKKKIGPSLAHCNSQFGNIFLTSRNNFILMTGRPGPSAAKVFSQQSWPLCSTFCKPLPLSVSCLLLSALLGQIPGWIHWGASERLSQFSVCEGGQTLTLGTEWWNARRRAGRLGEAWGQDRLLGLSCV